MDPTSIMLVEDEYIVAADLKAQLISLGYEIAGHADSGESALETIADADPDVVLMDIQLKGEMDGIDTASQVRKLYGIPVVFLTAHADDELVRRAKGTEPYGYVVKPYESQELRANIEIAVHKGAQEKERREHAVERERLISELQTALAEIKALRGFLPICSHCKKIRDDEGYWQQLEKYIEDHSDVLFSHSFCPDCAREHYPEFYDK